MFYLGGGINHRFMQTHVCSMCFSPNYKLFNFKLPKTHNSFIYLVEGEIKIGNKEHKQTKDSTLILLTKGDNLKITAINKAKFLLISGKPIGEQIARGGPFVMNTKKEIQQAIEDYHSGTFVK